MDLTILENGLKQIEKNFEIYLKNMNLHAISEAFLANIYAETVNDAGKKQKLSVLHSSLVTIKNNKTLLVQPHERQNVAAFYKACSTLNATVQKLDNVIEIVLPSITNEDKIKFMKLIGENLNQYKMQVKNKRQDFLKDFKKLSKEELGKIEKKVQEKIDKTNGQLDALFKAKEKDVAKV